MLGIVDEATLIVEEHLTAGLASRKSAAVKCGCLDCRRSLASYEAWLRSCVIPDQDDDPHVAHRHTYSIPEPTTEAW